MDTVNSYDSGWEDLLERIESHNIIPVIGQGIYWVKDEEGKDVLLYDLLAEQIANECGITIPPGANHKFFKAAHHFLSEKKQSYFSKVNALKRFLLDTFRMVEFSPSNPLWKLARIKAFKIFITTVYDDFLADIIRTVRNIPTESLSYTLNERGLNLLNDELFYSLEESRCTLVYHLFGNLKKNISTAYTENDIHETIFSFQRDTNAYSRNNLFRKLENSSLLFIGCGFEDWLYRLFIRAVSNQPFKSPSSLDEDVQRIFVSDVFKPSDELPQFLVDYGGKVFYSSNGGSDFVDTLFAKLEQEFTDEIIPVSDFPETVHSSSDDGMKEEIRELLNTKSDIDYIEARSKLLSLKESQPAKFEKLKSEFGFLVHLDKPENADIHSQYREHLVENSDIYGAQFAKEIEDGWVGIALPNTESDKKFITIPGNVFEIISKESVIQFEQLGIRDKIERRIKNVEKLFKLKLYEFALGELRANLEFIERNTDTLSIDIIEIKESNFKILENYYTKILVDDTAKNDVEVNKPVYEFRNKIRLILEWGEFFSIEVFPEEKAPLELPPQEPEGVETRSPLPKVKRTYSSPGDKGYELEKAIFELFQKLFKLNEFHELKVKERTITKNEQEEKERYLKQKRWQQGGNQYGYDLEFTWNEVLAHSQNGSQQQHPEVRCLVECKHYAGEIDHYQLSGKLGQAKISKIKPDHWILISPHANLTPSAKKILGETKDDYPFDIHIWTPEFKVEEFFGIDPYVFEQFYDLHPKDKKDKIENPRLWSDGYRYKVINRWLDKLVPKYRLPNGRLLPDIWVENLKNAEKTLISFEGEDYYELHGEWKLAIKDSERLCLNEDGTIGVLLDEFLEWMENEDCYILALLGDFGSGKTLHGYSLGIEAARMFLRSPEKSRIPIRLSLKHCMDGSIKDVLEDQLLEMNTSYEEFAQLNPKKKIIFILDGFDEMSRYITQKMNMDRFRMLRRFCNRYKDAKILLTCRTQYFESAENEKEILRGFEINERYRIKRLYLREFSDKDILACVQNRCAESPDDPKSVEMMEKMRSKYDLIGLSKNPLILSIITKILDDISTDNKHISQTSVYETYINKWLEREITKTEMYIESEKSEIKKGVKRVMYELAYQIYKKKDFKLSYEELKSCLPLEKKEALELFLELTKYTEKSEVDIPETIKTRSFLSRDKDYFRFVHRSIMEYFIAEKVYLEVMEEKNVKNIDEVQLSFEIINFISDLVINRNTLEFLKKLKGIHSREKQNSFINRKWLGANVLAVFYTIKKEMSKKNMEETGIGREDWSGISAHGSLLMKADLSRAIFRDADLSESHFENADLRDSDFRGATLTNIVLGDTEDIVYAKWGPISDEIPYSIHSDGNLFNWKLTTQTPLLVSQYNKDILPPCDISFPGNSLVLFIGGVLQEEKKLRETIVAQEPTLLRIGNPGRFIAFYKKNRIIVFDVKKVKNLCTFFQQHVSALYIGLGGKYLSYVVDKKKVYYRDINSKTPNTVEIKENTSPITGIAVDKNGVYVFVGFDNGEIHCYKKNNETIGFSRIWNRIVHDKAVKNLSYNDNSLLLLSCSADKKISITYGENGNSKYQPLKMILKCKGMKIKGAIGLPSKIRDELIRRGAVINGG